MRVMIVDLTGRFTRPRRQDLERRLIAIGQGHPEIDAVEVDLESPAAQRRRARVTVRVDHRRVVRVSEEAPTLRDALDLALQEAAREEDALGAAHVTA